MSKYTEEERKEIVASVNERNTTTLLSLIDKLRNEVETLTHRIDKLETFTHGTQGSLGTLSDQVMGLMVWRAQMEQNRGDDD